MTIYTGIREIHMKHKWLCYEISICWNNFIVRYLYFQFSVQSNKERTSGSERQLVCLTGFGDYNITIYISQCFRPPLLSCDLKSLGYLSETLSILWTRVLWGFNFWNSLSRRVIIKEGTNSNTPNIKFFTHQLYIIVLVEK